MTNPTPVTMTAPGNPSFGVRTAQVTCWNSTCPYFSITRSVAVSSPVPGDQPTPQPVDSTGTPIPGTGMFILAPLMCWCQQPLWALPAPFVAR